MNKELFDSLSKENQTILTEAAKEAVVYARQRNAKQISQQIEYLKEQGMEITDPDLTLFRKAVQPVYDKYEDKFGEILKKIEAAKKS